MVYRYGWNIRSGVRIRMEYKEWSKDKDRDGI